MIRRPLPPLLLARPSRFASLSIATARLALAVLGVALLVSWTAMAMPDPTRHAISVTDGGDVQLYRSITDALRHGGSYYAVAADALRSGGYPLRPFVTFRLPTLAILQAQLPAILTPALLYLLGGGVAIAWFARLRAALLPRPSVVWSAMLLLAGGCVACWQAELTPCHEVWAGLLIALSLARHRPGRWVEAVGWGLAAAIVRETAALYLLVMLALAWRDGHRREATAWLAALAVLAAVIAAHAHAVAQVVGPLDPVSPDWSGMLGPGFVVRTWSASTALSLMPLGLAAPLVAQALAGWAAWDDPLGARVATTLGAYLLLAAAGGFDTLYWGLLTAPVLLVGLAFAPDAVRDLIAGALDKRRITVRRVVQ